ncbi:MAG: hypothetical protein AB7R90_04050 [Reyranellaceae bacterium]
MADPLRRVAAAGDALARVGREIRRVAIALEIARANRRDPQAMAPTPERLRHGQSVETYDGAVAEAGLMGHRVVEACLLDALRERGVLGKGEAALVRHSAGLWLRGLFHDSGLERAASMRVEGVQSGGDPTGAPVFERSHRASRTLAIYQLVMAAMERRDLHGADRHGRAAMRMTARQKRRATHAVREIACWDRWPSGFSAEEVRRAFDRLAAMEDRVAIAPEDEE